MLAAIFFLTLSLSQGPNYQQLGMTSSWHDASIGLQKRPSVLSLFHFTPCQTQTCYTGEACCHMCFVLLSVLFQQLWYRQQCSAHIFGCEYCKYRMNCSPTLDCGELWSVFCLSYLTLRSAHQHYYVRRWRRESVAVLH